MLNMGPLDGGRRGPGFLFKCVANLFIQGVARMRFY